MKNLNPAKRMQLDEEQGLKKKNCLKDICWKKMKYYL